MFHRTNQSQVFQILESERGRLVQSLLRLSVRARGTLMRGEKNVVIKGRNVTGTK